MGPACFEPDANKGSSVGLIEDPVKKFCRLHIPGRLGDDDRALRLLLTEQKIRQLAFGRFRNTLQNGKILFFKGTIYFLLY